MESPTAREEQLDARAIAAALGPRAAEIAIEVIAVCGSTNTVLLEGADDGATRLLAAGHQTAGRGRHGRRWHSAPDTAICVSLRRRMRRAPREMGGASLAAGVAVVRALRSSGAAGVALKWPNDLLATGGGAEAKLGGILIETRLQAGVATAVVGIGVNYRSTPGLGARLRREIAALEELIRPLPSRNLLIGRIAAELLDVLESFDTFGLAPLRGEWESLHAHAGHRVRLRLADGRVVAGIHAGIAEDGAMCVRTRGGLRTLHSARVISARPA